MPDISDEIYAHLETLGIVGLNAKTMATNVSSALGSRAFTAGEAVVLTSYVNDGKGLVSHELTHVLQQRQKRVESGQERKARADTVAVSLKRDPKGPVKVEWTYATNDGQRNPDLTYSKSPTRAEVRKAVDRCHPGSIPPGIGHR